MRKLLFNCKDLDACKNVCSISKRFAILLVMMVMVGSKALAGANFEVINGLKYLLEHDTKTATLLANTEKYAGDIVVPESVKAKDGNVYTIIAFGDECFNYCTKLTSVTIPSNVISLGNDCFSDCDKLTSIKIPSKVTSLGNNCFNGCRGLKSIELPPSVTSLGEKCFAYCLGLTSIEISSSVTSLRDDCFFRCSSLTSIEIPSSVTSIGYDCFSECSSLTSIEIPSSVTSLGAYCFRGCIGLTSVKIPSSVTSLSEGCFSGCSSLKNINIPSSVTDLGNSCFNDCSSLTSIEIPSSVMYLGVWCFQGCKDLTSIEIPSSITSLSKCCFRNCSGLTSITIPSSVTTLGGSCFAGCISLTSIDIPSSVTSLGAFCFHGCSSLKSITIPSSVTSLEFECFDGHTKLESLYFKGRNPENLSRAEILKTCIIYVPTKYLQDYKDALGTDYKYIYTWNPNESGEDYKPVTRCATPTISYESKELKFACETSNVKYHYTIRDMDMVSTALSENGKVSLRATYYISVYATADGHSASETATATLYWLDAHLDNPTNINKTKTRGILASAHDGIVSVSGLDNGEEVKFYAADGKYIGQAVATNGTASYAVSEALVIAKVGNNSIKIAMK